MPTESVTMVTPDAPPSRPTACLLHADIHVMGQACWGATLDWYLAHEHLEAQEARDDYQAAVERKMLDDLTRKHHPDAARRCVL